jgi:hypothetical protein
MIGIPHKKPGKGWRKSALSDIMADSTRKADYEKKN